MKEDLPEPIFLSAPKAATLCGVSRNTICCWIRDGKLPSYRTAGGKYLIRPGDLIDFMQHNDMFVPPALEEIAREDERRQGQTASPEQDTTQEPTILVVDDDEGVRELIARTLKPIGLPFVEAENGYDALHQLTKNPLIALVVLDLIMPGQSGENTFREIRKTFPSLPVIICTGLTMKEAESLFADQKPDLILTKPYNPGHMIEAASTFLADLGF